MFNGAKQTFGAATTTGFGYNNAAQASPFGAQPAFGKPATAGFGQTPAFGQQTSLFGATQPTTSLFGSSAPAPAFGAPAATTQSGFGGFGQPQQQAPLFGAAAQPQQNTSLFGQPSTSAFGAAAKPAGFGFGGAQQTTSLFGQPSTSAAAGTGFGGFGAAAPAPAGGLFGASAAPAFGQTAQPGANGSAIAKYQPSLGTDTLVKNGQTNTVSTKQHCITAMKEYEGKCLEEIRMEDYLANRKGPQAGAAPPAGGMFGSAASQSTGMFGAPASQPTTGLFGQQQPQQQPQATNTMGGFGTQPNTLSGFGQQAPAFGQQQAQQPAGGLFGKSFAAPATSTAPFGGFSTAAAPNTNLFGAKPFGQPATGGLFGQPAASTAPTFGQQQSSFGSFGQTSVNQPAPLFGAATTSNAGGFGMAASAPNNSFGGFSNPTTNTVGGGLFAQKPATGFGAAPAFGAPTSTAGGFGSFGQPNQPGSMFNSSFNKPAAPSFGAFGTQQAQPTLGGLGGGLAGGTSMFGNTAAKPGGLFGNTTAPAGGGLFGSSFGTSSGIGGIGQNTMGLGQGLGSQQQPGVSIHQQMLSLTTSPYGDNPIFKDLKPMGSLNEDALKPTNPAAQKAMLESSAGQFKISLKAGSGPRVKPVGSALTKKSLFGGLEEYDSSVAESFSLKPNAKRLIIKAKPATQSPSTTTQSPAHQASKFGNTSASDTLIRQNIPTRNTTPRPAVSNDSALDESESFRNEIPQSAPPLRPEDENNRRVSWLHSNALEKVTKQNRLSDFVMDNTIQELVTTKDDAIKEKTNVQTGGQSGEAVQTAKSMHFNAHTSTDSLSMSRSFLDETNADISLINTETHPSGIVLQRSGYYTIPPMDKLIDYMTEDGSCKVPNFTIGRKGYGNVYFDGEIDIAGLNLDELVHFRHKEVIIYPDDENKPPVGQGLNRKAQITLDQVWPHDKTLREPIKDRTRLEAMDYEGKLRRVCDKHDMRFIDYRPETGSWVFKVDHFSKYGLNDSDEEDLPVDPKKAKLNEAAALPKNGAVQTVATQNAEKNTGAIPKLPKPVDTDTSLSTQQGLGGFDARYDTNADDFSMDYTTNTTNFGYRAVSPSAAIAMEMGADSHKLQLMKASFFIDDEYDGKSVVSEQLEGRDSPDQIVPNKPFLRHNLHPAFSIASTQSKGVTSITNSSKVNTPIESPALPYKDSEYDATSKFTKPIGPRSLPLIVKPKVALVKIPKTVIPLGKSIISDINGKCAADMAFMHGRKFKIGWGSQNAMFVLSTFENCQDIQHKDYNMEKMQKLFSGRASNDYTRSVLLNFKINATKQILSFQESIEAHLQTQLQMAKCNITSKKQEQCPHFKSAGGSKLLAEQYAVAKQNEKISDTEEYAVTVWSLCMALWGDEEELDGQDINSHLTVTRRRELLSQWLEKVVTEKDALRRAQVSKISYLGCLLNLLSCHKVADACELAFNNDDINLSLLLAQLSGGPSVRQLIQHQLSSWQDVEADAFIAVERLKAFMLVAGIPLLSSSHGPINIYDDLDWLKSFALNVWYLCPATSSITDALIAYERSFQSEEFHAVSPTPPYVAIYEIQGNKPVEDLRYHILKLFSKRSHPLESLLNPATHTSDPMDFRLSWLLLQALDAIGYHHCSTLAKCQLHVSFASQLENFGLWHWSIFVLLHIDNESQRELSVQNILYKYIMLSGDDCDDDDYNDKESFIVNELQIPKKWIYWAKAVRAGAMNKYHAQADYLLKAEQWAMAHKVIMENIAPDAIINDNILYVKGLLNRLSDPRQIPNWSNEGSILLDYIEISEKFENLKTIDEDDIETSWEQLKPQLSELCSRINLFPCPTSKHRLCQSEIAQRLANLVSGIRIMCPELNSCLLMRVILDKLPLPQEYAKQKFRTLLEDSRFVEEMQQRSN